MENGLAYFRVVLSGYILNHPIISCSGEDMGGGSGDYAVEFITAASETLMMTLNANHPEDPLTYCPPTP